MKLRFLLICSLPTIALAQVAPRPAILPRPNLPPPVEQQGQVLSDNYLLMLSVADAEKPVSDLSIVVATPEFRIDAAQPAITFSGSLTPQEDGSVLVRYTVGSEIAVTTQTETGQLPGAGAPVQNTSVQYKTSAAQASVKLRLDQPLQILKSGSRTFRLTVSRLAAGSETKAQ
ncbi:hypothetical protein ACXR0O_12955 [Verrucomicrobiota bacterium sgz303538]